MWRRVLWPVIGGWYEPTWSVATPDCEYQYAGITPGRQHPGTFNNSGEEGVAASDDDTTRRLSPLKSVHTSRAVEQESEPEVFYAVCVEVEGNQLAVYTDWPSGDALRDGVPATRRVEGQAYSSFPTWRQAWDHV